LVPAANTTPLEVEVMECQPLHQLPSRLRLEGGQGGVAEFLIGGPVSRGDGVQQALRQLQQVGRFVGHRGTRVGGAFASASSHSSPKRGAWAAGEWWALSSLGSGRIHTTAPANAIPCKPITALSLFRQYDMRSPLERPLSRRIFADFSREDADQP